MSTGSLGGVYTDGRVIVRQGDSGDCMFIVQSGQVEVVQQREGVEVRLATLGPGEFFGEMALFERQPSSATVRAVGEARVLTVDKRMFLRRVREDPSLALRILEKLCERIRELDGALATLRVQSR